MIDPVLAASAGGDLLAADALPALRELLLPLATVLTPNLPEAARLLDVERISDARGRGGRAGAAATWGPRPCS